MKKVGLILLLLCQIIAFQSASAQVNYGGVTYPLNGTSAGINTYGFTGSALPRYGFQRYPDGYWYYIADLGFGQRFVSARTAVPYLTNDPPCNVVWITPTRFDLNIGSFLPIATYNPGGSYFLMTGTCSPISSSSSYSGPLGFVPPSLTSTEIAAIVTPALGTLVWDITVMCLKVYNGTAWVCL
jgi:hypothetical protein